MIVGVGTDIVNIDRIADILNKNGQQFIDRICRDSEKDYVASNEKKELKLAKIWAVKEAAVKALGTGFACGIGFHDIELRHDDLGKPELVFLGKAKEILMLKSNNCDANVWVGLSDDKPFAQAVVIIEKI